MSDDDYDLAEAKVIHMTRLAALVQYEGKEIWIPKSVIDGGDDLKIDDVGILVKAWWAEKEGL